MRTSSTNRGFTLIELLTVVAIIGVLAALLFPAIKSAMLKAEVNKAQTAITSSLATAIRSYYTEYGHWPIVYPAPLGPPVQYENFLIDRVMIALLSGEDVGGSSLIYPSPGPYRPYIYTAGTIMQSPTAVIQNNPRKIVFHEFKNSEINSLGYFVDPWTKPYYFRLDVNYQNQITYPFAPQLPGTPITAGFLIWSNGPDGQYDQNDTVVPPTPPLTVTSSVGNKDNVRSW